MERCDLGSDSIVAVGDGENDICMLKEAGSSIAFQPKNKRVRNAAKFCAQRMSEVAWLAGAMQMRESFAEAESELNETLSN
jgi:phosphoserine phosphatase